MKSGNKIRAICFDLDGCIIETKELHFKALNLALGEKYSISWQDHLTKYDGLKTTKKLNILSEEKGLPIDSHKQIWEQKQKITIELLGQIKENIQITECIKKLSNEGYKIACCSNSINKSVLSILSKMNIIEYFDLILSNESVLHGKPHPSIYWMAMSNFGILPEETLILEDSPFGLKAAISSCANVLRISSPKDVTYDNIKGEILNIMNGNNKGNIKWVDKKLNVLIAAAGLGTRFKQAGYTFPKPLIEVLDGKPMIQVVVENLNIDANYIYIVQQEHQDKYNISSLLKTITPNCKIVYTDKVTQGAACSILLAKELINNDSPLFLANSDQFVIWNSSEFLYKMQESNADGGIVTFNTSHPRWSFAKIGESGFITEVAEKNPISNIGTVGFYFYKHGSDFVKYAEQMIQKDIRVNGEYYSCPVFNEAIQDGKKIIAFQAESMFGVGTPEDLEYFLKNYDNRLF